MKPHSADEPAREGAVRPSSRGPGAAQTVATLFGIGTRRCRLAAAFVGVMVGLAGHPANQAYARAEETVLYLDAPAVSTDRATRAGETAQAHHSDPRSSAPPNALAWLGVRGPREDDTEAPPQDAAGAFASVTAPDAEGTPGITAQTAYVAGETMLAQVEDVAPAEDGGRDELAAAGAVRPELGDGTRASEERPSADHEAPPAEQPTTANPASSPEPIVPDAEPSGDEGLALDAPTQGAPAQTELAAAPGEDASPASEIPLDTEPDYGATGPISEPAPTPEPSAEPETQEEEIQEPELQEPETQNEEVQEPEDDDGELAGAAALPAASPGPADEMASEDPASNPGPAEEPAHDDPAATVDTGPTSDESGDVALAPTSSPEDDGPDDLASASPAPEESAPEVAAPEDGSEAEVSEEQISEVVVVQESDAGEGNRPAASRSPGFTLPGDEAQDDPGTDTGPPPWTSPSEETEPKAAAPAEEPLAEDSPARKPTDDGAGEEEVPLSGVPEGQPSDQTGNGSGETTSPPRGGYAQESAPDTPPGASPNDEGTAGNPSGCGRLLHSPEDADCDGVPDTPPPEEVPTSDEARPSAQAPAEDSGRGGGQNTPRDPGSVGDAGEGRPSPDGGPHGPPEPADESLVPSEDRTPDPASGDGGITDPRPEDETPGGGTDRRSENPREDHRGDRGDRGHSFAVGPDERMRRAEEGDGGAGADPGGAEEPAPASTSAEPYPEEPTAGEPARPRPDTEPVASRSAVDEVTATPETRLADGKVRARSTPPTWDRRVAAGRAEERREARQAERFAARVAERRAERRASRTAAKQAAREQAAVERAAVRGQQRQDRPAAGGAFDARGVAFPVGRRRTAPAQDPVPQPAAVESDSVRQVAARRFVPVEQPAAADLPPAGQEPAAQVRAGSPIRRPFGSGDAAGQASGVERVGKSADRSVGRQG